jgi:Leishmanolysin
VLRGNSADYIIAGTMRRFLDTAALMYAAAAEQSNLRTTQQKHQRQHIVRRLYGEENALVRKEIRMLEERMTRYQTGFNADPNHIVPYEDHPYDPAVRRKLGSTNSTEDKFKPMRVHFETKALDDIRNSSNAAKIDWIKNEILPRTANFWSSALAVVPVSGNLRISSSELDSYTYCGDPEFTKVPNQDKSNGVENTDLILYVSGSASERFCPERTLAVAVPCNFDQFDRPTAGAVNVCLGNIVLNSDGTATDDVVQDYVDVTIHEVGHVLGMSSNSYRFFWDPDTGTPRTERPFVEQTATCVDGSTKSLALPAENTLVFSDDYSGQRTATIVTPKVRAVARNQFNCQSMLGAQLENHPTRADSCTGDHWIEKLFYPEAMSAVISPTTNILSSLTLALMEDSGWYKANYTTSRMSPWGLGVGCSFVNKPCLTINDSGETIVPSYAEGFFCNQGAAKGCSPEHTHKLACTVLDYTYYTPQVLPGAEYQYFKGEPTKGGPQQIDFCPVYGTTYNNLKTQQLNCSNPDNAPSLNVYR